MIDGTRYNDDGSIAYRYTYEYDANGNKVRENTLNADGSLEYWNEYEWKYFKNVSKNR